MIQWFKNIEIIKRLINLFEFKNFSIHHSNASQLICDIIRVSREQILNAYEQILENKNLQQLEYSIENANEIIEKLYKNSLLEEIEK